MLVKLSLLLLIASTDGGALTHAPPSLAADTLGSITGRVVAVAAGGGVSAAGITLSPSGRTTSTAPNGGFAFHKVPSGNYELVAEHLAYGADTTSVRVTPGETTSVEIRLSDRVFQMDPLSVTVRREYLESVGFYERMETKNERHFFTPERLERLGIRNLGQFRPEILLSNIAFAGGRAQELKKCDGFAYFLDGRYHEWGLVEQRVRDLSASDVGAVEVYPYGIGLPTFAVREKAIKCGAVVVWTKRW